MSGRNNKEPATLQFPISKAFWFLGLFALAIEVVLTLQPKLSLNSLWFAVCVACLLGCPYLIWRLVPYGRGLDKLKDKAKRLACWAAVVILLGAFAAGALVLMMQSDVRAAWAYTSPFLFLVALPVVAAAHFVLLQWWQKFRARWGRSFRRSYQTAPSATE